MCSSIQLPQPRISLPAGPLYSRIVVEAESRLRIRPTLCLGICPGEVFSFVVKIGDVTNGEAFGETCEIQDDQSFSGDCMALPFWPMYPEEFCSVSRQ